MLGDGLGHTVKNALQIVQLAGELHLDDDDVALGVLRLDVDAGELAVGSVLVCLALQYLVNHHRLADEHSHQTLEHTEVGLVTEYPLHGPVETDDSFVVSHNASFFCRCEGKDSENNWNDQEKERKSKERCRHFTKKRLHRLKVISIR